MRMKSVFLVFLVLSFFLAGCRIFHFSDEMDYYQILSNTSEGETHYNLLYTIPYVDIEDFRRVRKFDVCLSSNNPQGLQCESREVNTGYDRSYRVCSCGNSDDEWVSCIKGRLFGSDFLNCEIPAAWVDENAEFQLVARKEISEVEITITLDTSRRLSSGGLEIREISGGSEDPEDPELCSGGMDCVCHEGQALIEDVCTDIPAAIPCEGACEEGERCDTTTNTCVVDDPDVVDDPIDQDGIPFDVDNCPGTANADQLDSDNDDLGDACDRCPLMAEDADIDGEEAEFRAMPAAGCPAGVAPTQGRSVAGGGGGGGGGGASSGGCSSIASKQSSNFIFVPLFLVVLFFVTCRIVSQNSRS